MSDSTVSLQPVIINQNKIKEYTLDLAQAANTYDIMTAAADIIFEDFYIYVATAGATFTSVAIQTNDTTVWPLMTAAEGAVASLLAGAHINSATKGKCFKLTSGKKLQFTIVGLTGTGSLRLGLVYRGVATNVTL